MESRPSKTPSRRQRLRQQVERARRHRGWWLFGLTSAIILAGVSIFFWVSRPQTPVVTEQTDEKYYFADSKYQGIRSKFVTRQSKDERVSMEYPVTGQPKIDRTIAAAIDRDDMRFRQAVRLGSQFGQPMTATTSYQVTHHDDRFLSITVTTNQDIQGAHPTLITHFWTFRKADGHVMTLRDVAGGSDESVKALLAAAKDSVVRSLKQRDSHADLNLDDIITEEALGNFVAGDQRTMVWPFGRGAVLASSYGEITVRVSLAELAPYLQNETAKSLFVIPDPPKPQPKPQPGAAPGQQAGCAGGNCVALTFDDGPGPHTGRLLDMLEQRGAKATFYVLGSKVSAHAGILQRMQAQGHQIGNHSWGHADLTRLDAAGIAAELNRTNDAIRQVVGKAPATARPPYGAMNATVTAQLGQAGLSSVLWSVDTRDWADRNSQVVCSRAVANARSGAIILLHDIHGTSVDAVPCIVDTLKNQGYRFVTVDELLGPTTPGMTYTSR